MNKLTAVVFSVIAFSVVTVAAQAKIIGHTNVVSPDATSQRQYSDILCAKSKTPGALGDYLRKQPGFIMWQSTEEGTTEFVGCYLRVGQSVRVHWEDSSESWDSNIHWIK